MPSKRRLHVRVLGVSVSVGVLLAGGFIAATSASAAGRYGYVPASAVLRVAGPRTASAAQGAAVAASADGHTVAVGAKTNYTAPDAGRVYLWNEGVEGWTLTATLQEPAPMGHSFFGSRITLSADGRHLAVANRTQAVNDADSAGAVYIYSLHGATWTLDAQVLDPTGGRDYDEFGNTLALNADGSELVVQSLIDHSGGWGSAVYVFAGAANGTWTQTAALTGTTDHMLLDSIALSGDGTVLSLAAYRFQPFDDQGTDVLIFERDPRGVWAQTSALTPSGPRTSYATVVALSTDGSTLATSSPGAARPSVTVFRRTGPDWLSETTLVSHSSAAQGRFGDSLAISTDGSTIVVGADYRSARGIDSRGGVYTFHRDTTGWGYLGATYIARSRANEYDGRSVAVSGDGQEVVIGAPGYSTNGDFHTLTGAAYIVG